LELEFKKNDSLDISDFLEQEKP